MTAGYSQEKLTNALSILSEMRQMLAILHREAGYLMTEEQTDESQRFCMYVWQISGKAEKICSTQFDRTSYLLSELKMVQELFKEPPK